MMKIIPVLIVLLSGIYACNNTEKKEETSRGDDGYFEGTSTEYNDIMVEALEMVNTNARMWLESDDSMVYSLEQLVQDIDTKIEYLNQMQLHEQDDEVRFKESVIKHLEHMKVEVQSDTYSELHELWQVGIDSMSDAQYYRLETILDSLSEVEDETYDEIVNAQEKFAVHTGHEIEE